MNMSFDVVAPSNKTPFQRALQQYLEDLDEKAKAKDFFVNCYDQIRDNPTRVDPNDADQINHILQGRVDKNLKKSSTTGKVMQTLVELQQKYDEFVNTLIALDPTSISQAVWKCIGILAKVVDGYFKVPKKIADALMALGDDLKSIETYDRLFKSSPTLEDVFYESYLVIFRFWNRVFQELLRKKPMRMLASLAGPDKLDAIISDMQRNAARVKEMATLVEKTRTSDEKKEGLVRLFFGQPIHAAARTSTSDNYIPGSRQAMLEKQCCEWIFGHPTYQSWLKGDIALHTLWVHGPPGSGKSTLCRRVAQAIEESNPSAVVASHYFRFDQSYDTEEVLKSLAAQLWDRWVDQHSSPALLDKIAALVDKLPPSSEPLRPLITILHELTKALPAVYFFVDGVDEEAAKKEEEPAASSNQKIALGTLDVLDTLMKSIATSNGTVRLWISSQEIRWTQEKFKNYVPFSIKNVVKAGIHVYLSQTIGELSVIPHQRQQEILQELIARAESNFLWAHLLVLELRKAKNEGDMDEVLESGRTKGLHGYFENFFDRRLKEEDIALSRDVFSLVTFALRPLRVGEVHEAVSILWSEKRRRKDPKKQTIFLSSLLEAFSPLIEVQDTQESSLSADLQASDPSTGDGEGVSQKSCRLFHSTLFDFLKQKRMCLFYDDQVEVSPGNTRSLEFSVSQLRIAESCLLYLAQPSFSQLFRQADGTWVDKDNKPVSEHHFLLYSAKNWDKHLTDVIAADGDDNPSIQVVEKALSQVEALFNARVENFLTSSNYGTCLQTQSLWSGAYAFYPLQIVRNSDFIHIYPGLPSWSRYKKDYHRFWWDWSHLLGWSHFPNVRDVFKQYAGEVNRCWWESLGSDNIFSALPSRYRSYKFTTRAVSREEGEEDEGGLELQTAHATCNGVQVLWRTSGSDSILAFVLEAWTYGCDKLPELKTSRPLSISKAACRASLFTCYPDSSNHYGFSGEGGCAPLAAFSDDGHCLRIGTQVYTIDSVGECRLFPGITAHREAYIEEIAGNSHIVVVTNRKSASIKVDRPFSRRLEDPDPGTGQFERREIWRDETGELNELLNEALGSDQEDDFADGGWESWSECSSAESNLGCKSRLDLDSESDFEEEDQSGSDSSTDSGTTESDSESEIADGFRKAGLGKEQVDSTRTKDEEDAPDSDNECGSEPLLSFYQIHHQPAYNADSDVDDESTGDDPGQKANSTIEADSRAGDEQENKFRQWTVRRSQVSLRIFTPTGRILSFLAPLSTSLSDSPPVLHPTQSLVVWPLNERSILLVDYQEGTYFTRELGTIGQKADSPSHENISSMMRCSFTSDGKYLHIASFEGRSNGPQPAYVKLILYTYKLCANKPTRAPPMLLHSHEMDLDLFGKGRLDPKFPYTLTWTDSHLYVASSCPALYVYKLSLLREETHGAPLANHIIEAQYPKRSVPIPASAEGRNVFFFPSEDDSLARIIVGAPIIRLMGDRPMVDVSTPVGCNMDIQEDFGGWSTRIDPAWSKGYNDLNQTEMDAPQGKSGQDGGKHLEHLYFQPEPCPPESGISLLPPRRGKEPTS